MSSAGNNKKIALLVPNFVDFDGAGQVVRLQAEEFIKDGCTVAIFTFAAGMEVEGARIFVMGMPKSLFWERIYRLLFPLDIIKTVTWLPKLKRYDEIIVHLYPMTWLACLAKRFYKVKYSFWYHGIMPPRLFPHFYERVYMRLQILLTKLTTSNTDRAVAVSNYGKKELKLNTGLQSEVVYNPVDVNRFYPEADGSAVREQYDLGDAPVILFVGAIRPVKGVHLLVQAFKLVKEQIPDARLMIVGRADYPYYLDEIMLDADDSVLFTGFQPQVILAGFYAACDVYASCSLWEIHNAPATQAQACGKPIVVWHESFAETVNENDILVNEGDIEGFARACIEKLQPIQKDNNE